MRGGMVENGVEGKGRTRQGRVKGESRMSHRLSKWPHNRVRRELCVRRDRVGAGLVRPERERGQPSVVAACGAPDAEKKGEMGMGWDPK